MTESLEQLSKRKSPICIAVATHKAYQMPSDPMYLPLRVGKAIHPDLDLGFATDDTGDNISAKNNWYSELTGLYWLWKNVDAPYKGLVHYRRHFETQNIQKRLNRGDRFNKIVGSDEVQALLATQDIILPKRRHYYVETIYSHHAHTFDARQADMTRAILSEFEPRYLHAFDEHMTKRSAHMFNMFIMRSERCNDYCSWLFPILFELEHRLPPDSYYSFGARYLGRVSEWLLDVWIDTNGYGFSELPVNSTEPVNWVKKGGSFLMAKVGVKKYEKSF